jgi:hypothetical protein
MLRPFRKTLLVMLASSATVSVLSAQTVVGTCAPKDAVSDRVVAKFKSIVTSKTLAGEVERNVLGIKTVTPPQIVPVMDKATCMRAAAALHTHHPEPNVTSYTVYIVTLGTSYGVMDNRLTDPRYALAFVFDHDWKYVSNQTID